jgi:hypothetical protein
MTETHLFAFSSAFVSKIISFIANCVVDENFGIFEANFSLKLEAIGPVAVALEPWGVFE